MTSLTTALLGGFIGGTVAVILNRTVQTFWRRTLK